MRRIRKTSDRSYRSTRGLLEVRGLFLQSYRTLCERPGRKRKGKRGLTCGKLTALVNIGFCCFAPPRQGFLFDRTLSAPVARARRVVGLALNLSISIKPL